VIDHSEKLKAECERLVEKEWYSNHYAELEKARIDLETINKNVKEAQLYYETETAAVKKAYEKLASDCKSNIEDLLEQKKRLTDDVNGLERLNSDIKAKVQDTITNARKDASEFIKDFAFQYGLPSSGDTEKPKQKEVLNYSIGVELPAEELQENKTWNDEIDTLSEELFTAGVDLKYRYGLAYILYAAFCLKIPLLLAGPSGANIANALSATIFGKKAGKLTCTGHYDKGSVDFMKQSDDGIVIISTPFHSEWVENIADIIEDRDKYYIFVCPFVEDLAIEPKGIFNYMLPVATEVFVSHFQEDIFCGGKRSSSFKAYSVVDPRIKYAKQMQMFRMSTLHKNHLQSVLTNAGNMGLDQPDIDYLVAFYAYTIATGKNETFMEILSQDKNKLSKAMNDYLEGIFGEDK
jgi:hypothetical protein